MYNKQKITIIKPLERKNYVGALGKFATRHFQNLTCLSGFVDQCESIEEAVALQVKEENGFAVHTVQILGPQT